MKTVYRILFFFLLISTAAKAQVYTMSTTTVTTCSGTFYDSGGSGGNYSNNENSTMTFTSSTGDRLSFAFSSLGVETCCDRLYIYDGPTNAYPLIGTYTSNPGTIVSTGASLTFTFTSDNGTTSSGWAATISCTTPALTIYTMITGDITACSGTFYDNGGPNTNYSNNENVTKTFCSGTSDFLRFDFLNAATNISAGDTLFIYDGSTSSTPLLGAYTNGSFIEPVTSSGTCLTFVFKSNATGNTSGWAGSFQCTTTPAGAGVFNMTTGIRGTCGGSFFDSGGSGGNYSNNENRTQSIRSLNGNRISMTFSSFAVETCCDRLYIYDGPTTAYPLIGIYTSNPGTIQSSGTSLTFTFTSDNGNTNSGWTASVTCTTPVLTVYTMVTGNVTACSGAFYDNGGPNTNYSDNQNVTKTFCSGTSDFLRFDFINAATNLAAGDTLFIYDGSTSSTPLLGAYTNGSFIEPVTSSGTCLTFVFKSNATGNASGWAGSFQCTSTPATAGVYNMTTGIRGTCGGGFYDSGGSGGNYSNNENRSQTIMSLNGNRISMTFTSFSVEGCCDRLYIYDGPTTAYPLIGIYTSNPGTIQSTGTSLTFTFTSDNGNTQAGWAATVSCTTPVLTVYTMVTGNITACSGAFYDNGGPNSNYTDNQNVTKTFCSGTSDFLRFDFINAATNFAAGDTLFIYDGSSSSTPLLGAYTNGSFIESVTSSGTCLTFVFKSNASGNASGWAGSFACTTTPASAGIYNMTTGIRGTCGGGFYDSGGSGGNYGNNENRSQTIQSLNGNRISMTFTSFSIEGCCDRLYIYDGPTTAYPLIGIYTSNPGTILSTGTSLTFTFTSDNSTNQSGWAATVTCTTPVLTVYTQVTGNVTACSGAFYDNGGPNTNYTDNQNVTKTFCSGTSDYLQFTFWQNACNLAAGDSLFIYDGSSTASPLLAIHTNASTFEPFTSSGTCVTFVFKSNATGNATGWAGWFQCTSTPPSPANYNMSGGVRFVCAGGFYDSGGSGGNYGNNENRTQTFTSYNGQRINFTFTSFSVETCCDRLYIYDGPSASYPLLGVYTSNPGSITSSGSSLTFKFTSDNATTNAGWAATISCSGTVLPNFNMSGGTVVTCNGVFFDNGGPLVNYPNNENRVMTFTSASGQYLRFDFNPNHFNIATGDSLFIYDGTSTSAPLFAILTGNTAPGPLTSNTSSFTFRFKSDGATNNIGWQAWISCVSAPDPNPIINMTGGVRYTCGGTFYDYGGSAFNYPDNDNRTMTFYSNSGCGIRFVFNSFNTESCCDKLFVYDGPSTASPLIATLSGSGIPAPVQSTGNALTFRFSSDNGITNSGWNATISCPNQPLALVTPSGPTTICSNSSVTLTASPNTSYLWNTGATTQSIVVNSAGSYWVTVGNALGCFATSTITTVNVNPIPTPAITAGGPTTFCSGGSVTLTASGGTSYLWSNNATSSSISVTSSGTYSVTATDANGCSATSAGTTVTVNPTPSPNITASGPLSFCIGGDVTLTASGGGTYLWSTGATTASILVNSSGTYTVSATNAFGCSGTSAPVTVTVSPTPTVSITASGPTTFCSGGTVTLTASGATSYLWSTGATSSSIVVSASGNYFVTGSNVVGCSANSSTVAVTVNPTPTVSITPSGPLSFCSGGNVTLTASGGGTYLWSNSATSASINVTSSGTFTVSATNAFGCSSTSSPVTVAVSPTPTVSITASGPTTFCAGGSVTLTATGANTYLWSTGATSSSIVVTTSGNYYVNGSSVAGCSSASSTIPVTVNPLPTPAVTASGPTTFCAGGSVTLTATGGNTYLWSTGATTNAITVNTSGNYSVTATNTFGCSATTSPMAVTVNPVPTPVITPSGPLTFCSGGNVSLSASGGTSYLWSTGATTPTILVNSSGTYSVTATNSFGCSASSSLVTVTVNPTPTVTATASGPTTFCAGGNVTLTASGASTYLWSTGATTNSIVVNSSGNYYVSGTDVNGCSATSTTIPVTVNGGPTVTVSASGPTTFCSGGNVTLTASGGTSYLWSTGATTSSILVASSGTYTVIATDALGCTGTSTPVVVNVLPAPTVVVTPSGPTTFCAGGNVTLTASGATSYLWSTGATTSSIVVSTSGNYTVTGTNASGCTAVSSLVTVTVNPLPNPVISAGGPTSFCPGGSVTLTATGGNTYLWSTGATTNSITVNTSGNYSVTATSSNGCTATSSAVTVTVNPLPSPVITASGPLTFCAGGNVTLTASGGNSYLWSTGATSTSIVVNSSGTYSVTATNSLGCSDVSAPVTVTVNPTPTVTATASGPTTFCAGGNVTLNASGASSYLWSTGATTNAITVNSSGNYFVSGTDANGCSANSNSIPVTVNAGPNITISASGPLSFCTGDSVVLTASGANSYLWNTNSTSNSIVVYNSGTYDVSGTNSLGCTATSAAVTVSVNAPPTATITASGPTTFCQGDNVTLNASGGSSYLWNDNSTNASLIVSNSGTYYAIVSNGGCSDTSSAISVTVNNLPSVNLLLPTDTFCTNLNPFTLTGGTPAGGTYSGPGVNAGVLDPAAAGAGLHQLTYSYTDANGCTATATQNFVVDICNGMVTAQNGTITAYPNPTDDLLTLIPGSNSGITQISLYDMAGRLILTENAIGKDRITISLLPLESGIYQLKTDGKNPQVIRVVKE